MDQFNFLYEVKFCPITTIMMLQNCNCNCKNSQFGSPSRRIQYIEVLYVQDAVKCKVTRGAILQVQDFTKHQNLATLALTDLLPACLRRHYDTEN